MSEPKSIGTSEEKPAVEYRDIPGFAHYRVGDDGTVWSCKPAGRSSVLRPWRKLVASNNTNGYPHVGLCKDGKTRTRLVHTLVLEAFVGPMPEGKEAAHENGVRDDARLSNLSWKTAKDNSADKFRHGTNSKAMDRATAEKIVEMLKDSRTTYATIASRCSVSEGSVAAIAQGRTWNPLLESTVIPPRDTVVRGEKVRNSKLTEADVVEIRAAAIAGVPFTWIAEKYGISNPVACLIARGRKWTHAPGPVLTAPRSRGSLTSKQRKNMIDYRG